MRVPNRARRLGAAAIAVGMGLAPGSVAVASAAPDAESSSDRVAESSSGRAASAGPAQSSRQPRAGRGVVDTETAATPQGERPLLSADVPEMAPEPEGSAASNKPESRTAPVEPAAEAESPRAFGGELSLQAPPPPVDTEPVAPASVPAAAAALPAAALPSAAISIPSVASLIAPVSTPAVPPLMVSAIAKLAPTVALVESIAAGLLGTNPDSPLAWGMLAAARGQLGRYRRGATVAPATAATATGLPTTGGAPATPPPFADNEVLVGWKPGTTGLARAQAVASVKATVLERLGTQKMLQTDEGVVYRLTVPGGTEAAIKALSNNPAVAFVEPNYRVSLAATSNDPYYTGGSLWGMASDDSPTAYGPAGTTNQYGCGAEEAWGLGVTGSRDVVVAVIDEGMQITHPDLAPNIWVNPGEVAGDGVDNDGNGYVDDVNGWDFYYDDSSVYDAGEDAHGTHVAGTIGAVGGNGTGVSGVNWNTRIIPAKFLGPQGGYISDAVSALNYLVDLKSRHNIKLVAANNSWGGGGYSTAMHGAILRAAKADILFVAAAGNATTDNDATASYPSNYSSLQAATGETAASYESVIAVASITSTGGLSSFSNYGAKTVDIGAPGSGIVSTVPTNSYASYNGTSMATPHVTGALALLASQNTTASASTLRSTILNNAKPTTSLAGRTVTGGRLSLEGLFGGTTPPPVATCDPAVTGISAPLTVGTNRNSNVTITVANLGNTAAQVNVALTATGGTPGPSTTLLVPAGGKVTTVIGWKSPKTRGAYTLTATSKLVNTTIVDANPANNRASVVVTVK